MREGRKDMRGLTALSAQRGAGGGILNTSVGNFELLLNEIFISIKFQRYDESFTQNL